MFQAILRLGLAGAAPLTPLLMSAVAADAQPSVMEATISVSDVKAAQDVWCNALVSISEAHSRRLAKSSPWPARSLMRLTAIVRSRGL